MSITSSVLISPNSSSPESNPRPCPMSSATGMVTRIKSHAAMACSPESHACVACRSISRMTMARPSREWRGAGNLLCQFSVMRAGTGRRITHLPPIWFSTSLAAPTRFAKEPAISGTECPLSKAFSRTSSGLRLASLPVASACAGIWASVAS